MIWWRDSDGKSSTRIDDVRSSPYRRRPVTDRKPQKPAQASKPVSPEKFLKYHSQWAQEVATQTGQVTDLYRDENGMPRATLEGWPQVGTKVATFQPQPRRREERRPKEAPAVAKAEAM